ncbi:MAG: Bifunctional primase/polymerase [Myxococcales bacterium]|nr:Bifunctional primase/polymerase [Myxococcales bacterium]
MSTSDNVVGGVTDQTTASGGARGFTGANTSSAITDRRTELLEHALRYIGLGWCLVPLAPGAKEPASQRRGAVWSWVHRHRMNPSQARSWFALGGCDIGIMTGAPSDDLAIIDIEGEFVEKFLARYDLPTNTPIASTPSGGLHIYVRDVSGRPTTNLYFDGVRIGELRRAAPSYVVAPPADGRRWITAPPWQMRLAYVPSWIIELVASPRRKLSTTPKQAPSDRPSEYSLPPVELRVRFAAERLSCGIVPAAIHRDRGHDALLRASVTTVRGYCVPNGDGVNNHAFDVLLRSYNPICVPPWTDSGAHQSEILHKLADAYTVGDMGWAELLDHRLALAVACGEVQLAVNQPSTPTADADAEGHPTGGCLIGSSFSWGPSTSSSSPASTALCRPPIEHLVARMPSRSVPVDQLLQLLHSPTRVIAEEGPRPSDTPESRAFVIALGCVYVGADVTSTTELLLNCKGGVAAQQACSPSVYARELWLDAWRARDREIATAVVVIADEVPVDLHPRGRALARVSAYLRPVDQPKLHEHQLRLDLPTLLGAPHAGEVSGEFVEAQAAFEAGVAPGRRDRMGVREAWPGALVLAVLAEHAGVRSVRHLLPLDAARRDEIRAVLAVCGAFVTLARPATV